MQKMQAKAGTSQKMREMAHKLDCFHRCRRMINRDKNSTQAYVPAHLAEEAARGWCNEQSRDCRSVKDRFGNGALQPVLNAVTTMGGPYEQIILLLIGKSKNGFGRVLSFDTNF